MDNGYIAIIILGIALLLCALAVSRMACGTAVDGGGDAGDCALLMALALRSTACSV